jgi:carbonic anhydrase/acetyltransferase-like protein (isoleucine patch superfamily)
MIHCSGELLQGNPTVIGENVTIGAGAKVHGCVLENECIIGEGSQIMDGAKVSSRSIISPGSIVPKGKVIPSGQLWGGIPAIYMRDLTLQETAAFTTIAVENTKLAAVHAFECAKTWEQIEHEAYDLYQRDERNEFYYKRLTEEEMSVREGEVQNHMVPGRILNTPISARK